MERRTGKCWEEGLEPVPGRLSPDLGHRMQEKPIPTHFSQSGLSPVPQEALSYLADQGRRLGGFEVADGSDHQEALGCLGVVFQVSGMVTWAQCFER